MLGFGLLGSVLLVFGGWYSLAGFLCVFLYYILDCVDGEVARYHHREKLIWGFHDFMFHLYVKSAFFICLGVYAARTTGKDWVFCFGLSALLACLFQKFLKDLTLILTCRYVILRGPAEREHFVNQLVEGVAPEHLAVDGELPGEQQPFSFSGVLPFVRAALTNFDLAVLLFVVASVLDLTQPRFLIFGITGDYKTALLIFYGVVFPFDFFDRLQTSIRSQSFLTDSRRLLRQAHHFRLKR